MLLGIWELGRTYRGRWYQWYQPFLQHIEIWPAPGNMTYPVLLGGSPMMGRCCFPRFPFKGTFPWWLFLMADYSPLLYCESICHSLGPRKEEPASSSVLLTSFTAMSFKTILFIYLWLLWLGLLLCSRGFFSCSKWGLLSCCRVQASHCGGFSCFWAWVLGCTSFRSCGTCAYFPHGMWDLPGLEIEPVSPALAGFLDHQEAS